MDSGGGGDNAIAQQQLDMAKAAEARSNREKEAQLRAIGASRSALFDRSKGFRALLTGSEQGAGVVSPAGPGRAPLGQAPGAPTVNRTARGRNARSSLFNALAGPQASRRPQ